MATKSILNTRLTGLALLLLLVTGALSAQTVQLFSRQQPTTAQRAKLDSVVMGYQLLQQRQADWQQLWTTRPTSLELDIPTSEGNLKAVLHTPELFTEDFKIQEQTDKGLVTIAPPKGLYYQGHIDGHAKSRIAISLFPNGQIVGVLWGVRGHRNMVIGRFGSPSGNNGNFLEQPVVVYDDARLKVASPFKCGLPDGGTKHDDEDGHEHGVQKGISPGGHDQVTNTCRFINNRFVAGTTLYTLLGSNTTTASNYLTALFNVSNQLYNAEQLQHRLGLAVVNSANDGINTSTSNTVLTGFRAAMNTASMSQNLGHYFTGDLGLGGLAYLNVMCNSENGVRTAMSDVYNQLQGLPTYSWDANVTAHETGHNIGSNHTQWCGWNKGGGVFGILDSCYAAEPVGVNPVCYNGPVISRTGTIMSYCHLTPGGVDLALGFGPIPGALIRTRFNAGTCLSGTSAVPSLTMNIPTGACLGTNVNISIATTSGATYQWFGPDGFSATTASATISNFSLAKVGYYYCNVTVNGCTYSSFPKLLQNECVTVNNADAINTICQGDGLPINLTLNTTPTASTSIVVQLSNNTGSFASPTTLGTFTNQASVNTTLNGTSSLAAGIYRLQIITTHNSITQRILLPLQVGIVARTTTPTTPAAVNICSGSGTTLTAPANGFANQWLLSNSVVGTGATLNTGNLTSSRTYQLRQTETSLNTFGRTTITGGSTRSMASNFGNWLRVYKACVIKGFTMNAASAGTGGITVLDSASGNPVASATFALTSGNNTITGLNISLQPGVYKLSGAGTTVNVYRALGTGGFPFRLAGVAEMLCADDGNSPTATTAYYWFYSIQMEYVKCVSNTVDYQVNVGTAPATPTITAGGPTTFCTGGSVTLSSSAGSAYIWSNGATTQSINVTTAGSYTVRTISSGCTSAVSNTITVTVNSLPITPTATAGGPTTFCTGGSVTLSSSAGSAYIWSNGATTQSINVTTAGSYSVRTISSGCTSAVSNTITVTVNSLPTTPTATAGGPTTFCSGGSVTLSSSAGSAYIWSNGATTQSINVTTAGSYSVRTISSGCTSAVSNTITVTVNNLPTTPTATAGGPTTFCTGGSVTLSSSAGSAYIWSNGATTQSINVTTAGSYTVRTISSGCTSAVSNTITVTVNSLPTTPTATAGGPTTFCSGGSVTLSSSAGSAYIWSNGATTQSINVTTAGSYTVRTISSGCTSAVSNTITVTVNNLPTTPTATAGGPTTFCTGGSVTLSSSAGSAYIWSNGATTQSINVTTAGSYTVRTISSGCTSAVSNTITVTVNSLPTTPTATAGGPTTFCSGGSVTLSSSAGSAYIWSNGATTQSINVTTAGSYTVRTISSGCTSAVSNTITVTVNSLPITPTATAGGPTTFCTGGSVTLSSSAGSAYIWSNGATTQSINVTTAGSYTVRTISSGCTSAVSNTITVTVNNAPTTPTITPGGPTTFTSGGSVVLTSNVGDAYLWSTNETTQSITVTSSGAYTVRTISNGCTSAVSSTINVTVNPVANTVWTWNGTGLDTEVANWTPASMPPPTADSVIINSGNINLTMATVYQKLVVKAGATVQAGMQNLSINGPLHNNGTISMGRLALSGTRVYGSGIINAERVNFSSTSMSLEQAISIRTQVRFGGHLALHGTLGSLTLLSSAVRQATIDPASTGTFGNPERITIERYISPAQATPAGAWFNIGPPVKSYAVGNLAQGNPFSADSYNQSVPAGGSVYFYDPTNNTWPSNNGYVKPSGSGQLVPDAEGVRVWIRQSRLQMGPLEFKGEPFLGNMNYALKFCPTGCTYGSPNGFNLLRNPYVGWLDWDNAGMLKNDMAGQLHIWRNDLQQFAAYVAGVGVNGGRNLIAPGQAFFVYANSGSSTLEATTSAVVSDSSASIFRSPLTSNIIRLQLEQNGVRQDEAALRLLSQATTRFDNNWDARNMAGNLADIFTMDPDSITYAIQSIPLTGQAIIPIGLRGATVGQQIRFTGINTLDAGIVAYLEHPSLSAPLTLTEDVEFTLSSAAHFRDLKIRFTGSLTNIAATTKPTISIVPNPASNAVSISIMGAQPQQLLVQDVLGRTVLQQPLHDLKTNLNTESLSPGTYWFRIMTSAGPVQRQVVIKR